MIQLARKFQPSAAAYCDLYELNASPDRVAAIICTHL